MDRGISGGKFTCIFFIFKLPNLQLMGESLLRQFYLRRRFSQFLGLGDNFLDGADHVEGGFGRRISKQDCALPRDSGLQNLGANRGATSSSMTFDGIRQFRSTVYILHKGPDMP